METDIAQNKELGLELARVREVAGLTQAELAARLSVSQTVCVKDRNRGTPAGRQRNPRLRRGNWDAPKRER